MVKLERVVKEYIDGQSVYIHCLAHCNGLTIKDMMVKFPMLAHATLIYKDIYMPPGISPKNLAF